jgi:hypothetical protein
MREGGQVMAMYIEERIKRNRPNGWDMELIRRTYHDDTDSVWFIFVATEDDGIDEWEFDNEADALAKFNELYISLASEPNWEAQADYDACHGDSH